MADAAIVAEGLGKCFGRVPALEGALELPAGGVLGLLGPNGAGKTTTVRFLATLLKPDRGRARVAGFDVAEHPAAVRRLIGLSGQYAAVDPLLAGRENLVMIGGPYGLSRRHARSRAGELIGRLELTGTAGRLVRTYSGHAPASGRRRQPARRACGPVPGRTHDRAGPARQLALWRVLSGLTAQGTSTGMIDRFRSPPISSGAVLAGRVAADAVRNLFVTGLMIGVGAATGFRFHAGPAAALAAVAAGLALSWPNLLLGLAVRDSE